MLNLFLPNEYVKDIHQIDPLVLKEKGIKGIITDLDNTLVAWDVREATDEVKDWLLKMKAHDIKVTILSNNNEERVKYFCEPLATPYCYRAKKPLKKAFKQATKEMGLSKKEVAVVGDQVLTDVLGGNRSGLYTILVVPIVQTDAAITKFNRKIERRILKSMRRKGKINWEE
ncbi:MAG TPA: YqeG family HAD IIIA-type phosphatase [Candidatus Avamphibacillus intestinigallinarum]|nr:YqeG family HAD IIIA-type phosphatase [Candidatus Avamphibacillus intestinigallinarum]